MGDWYIEIPFAYTHEIPIPKGSYIVYNSQKFEVMDNVYPEYQFSTDGCKYSLKFWAQQNHFKRCKVFYGRDKLSEVTFHDTATVRDFANIIIDNIRSFTDSEKWEVGEIPAELDINANPTTARRELISFDGTSCWDAVNQVAQTFEIEWWTNVNATTGIVYLNFGTCKFNAPIDFKQGEIIQSVPAKKGDTAEYGTRFFVFGGTQNLSPEYRKLLDEGGVTNHISEKRLCMRDDEGNYVDYIDARPNLAPAEVVEQVVKFDDIYPKSNETITDVLTVNRTLNVNNENKTFQAYVVTCKDTAYTDSLLMEGETLGCKFTSGVLNGREFELSTDNVGDKQFEIIHITETDGNGGTIILPGGTIISQDGTVTPNDVMAPAVNDTFILTGISLPEKNVQEAEKELYHKGLEYAEKNCSDTDVYDCPTNPVYCTENGCNYDIGQAVVLHSTRFKNGIRESRIQGYSKKLYNEYIATYTVGDIGSYSLISAVSKQIQSSEVSSKEYADNIVRKSERTSNRRYTSSKQTAEALAEANLEYFSNAINPVSVQTMQLLIGSDALQFDLSFPESGGISYSVATGEFSASEATLNHYTISNDVNSSKAEITYKSGSEQARGKWQITSPLNEKIKDATKPYWLYIKADKASDNAEYILSESTYSLDNAESYYFLVGLLNKEDSDGNRSWAPMYGYTEVSPGRIITEIIRSSDGLTWIDLNTGAASFADGKIAWDEKGDATMQNIEAKDSKFNNVTVKGSISQPFAPFTKESIQIEDVDPAGSGVVFIANRKDQEDKVVNGQNYYAWETLANGFVNTFYTTDPQPKEGNPICQIEKDDSITWLIQYLVKSYTPDSNIDGDEKGLNRHDNISLSVQELLYITPNDLSWGSENSGRLLRLANTTFFGVADAGNVLLTADDGKYFYEDGEAFSTLSLSREIVEIVGLGTEDIFYGWAVLNRKHIDTPYSYGSAQKVLYQGIIDFTATKVVKVQCPSVRNSVAIVEDFVAKLELKSNQYYELILDARFYKHLDNLEWEMFGSGIYYNSSDDYKQYSTTYTDGTSTKEINNIRIRFNRTDTSIKKAVFQIVSTADWQKLS